MTNEPEKKTKNWSESHSVKGVVVLFLAYLLFLFFRGSQETISDQYELQTVETLASSAVVLAATQKTPVIFQATFDEQGFPVSNKEDRYPREADQLMGRATILKFAREKMGHIPPEQVLKDFEGQFGYYWKDPKNPAFAEKSQDMAQKLTAQANRNRQHVAAIVSFLKSPAGKQVSTTLKENLGKSILSPAREPLLQAFSAWKNGDLDQAWRLLKQAETLDPDSPYIQIMAHHAMAFLNMEKHGSLEETMRQYRDLAEEGHKYIKSFKPALEKAGFDPVKLYGRDPFDAKGLPNKEQFEKAMNQSLYVQFEREYYKTHSKSSGKSLNAMRPETIEYMRKRQKGGAK